MSNDLQTGYHGAELLRAAAAATERAPQLADEIRTRAKDVAARVSAGEHILPADIDVRTLLGLIEQAGVEVSIATRRVPQG